jgi:hypothetical protein
VTGFFIRIIQKFFPGAFVKRSKLPESKYAPQLRSLEELLSYVLREEVSCGYASDGKEYSVVIVRTEAEIFARLTLHPKGPLRRSTYVKVHTDKTPLVIWFELAFLGMKVSVVPFNDTLLLTDQRPRRR